MANSETVETEPERLYYTADMVRELIREDRAWPRYECLYGELLVTPGPREPHQFTVTELVVRLANYVKLQHLDAVVYLAPADVSWGRDDVLVQPDVFVVPRDMAREARREDSWSPIRHLVLAVEVVSPSSRKTDRFKKRRLYQSQGVPCYWVVDPRARVVEVWTSDAHFPVVERERLVWHPEGADEPLVIALADLFAEP